MLKHLNLLNRISLIEAQFKGAALPIGLTEALRRMKRQFARASSRDQRHKSWPYCGALHRARISRQIDAGQITASNGLVGVGA